MHICSSAKLCWVCCLKGDVTLDSVQCSRNKGVSCKKLCASRSNSSIWPWGFFVMSDWSTAWSWWLAVLSVKFFYNLYSLYCQIQILQCFIHTYMYTCRHREMLFLPHPALWALMQRIHLAVLGGQGLHSVCQPSCLQGPNRLSDRPLVPDLFREGFSISSDLLPVICFLKNLFLHLVCQSWNICIFFHLLFFFFPQLPFTFP